MYNAAYHSYGEAVKFYLKGRNREIIGGEEYDVEAGFFAVTQGRRTPLAVQVPFKMRDDLRD